jgi:hypothetical protein
MKPKMLAILAAILLVVPLWGQSAAKLAEMNRKVVGKWVSADRTIEFRPDGSCSDDNWDTQNKISGWPQGNSFSCGGGFLTLIAPNTMTLDQGMGGEIEKFHRVAANRPNPNRASVGREAIFERLIGKWDGNDIVYDSTKRKYKRGAEEHCEFVRDARGVKFVGENGQVTADDNAYLTYSGGKLHVSYQMGKHAGTHGQFWMVELTLTLKDDGTLVREDSYRPPGKQEYRKRQG